MNYVTIILSAAKAVKVPGALLLAICMHETGLKNTIVKDDGGSPSIGICQMKRGTAEGLGFKGSSKDLMNPKVNAKYAALYLKYQIKRYDGNLCMATAAYNAGKFNESKFLPGYPRNLKYVKRVQRNLASSFKKKLSCDNNIIKEVASENY